MLIAKIGLFALLQVAAASGDSSYEDFLELFEDNPVLKTPSIKELDAIKCTSFDSLGNPRSIFIKYLEWVVRSSTTPPRRISRLVVFHEHPDRPLSIKERNIAWNSENEDQSMLEVVARRSTLRGKISTSIVYKTYFKYHPSLDNHFVFKSDKVRHFPIKWNRDPEIRSRIYGVCSPLDEP